MTGAVARAAALRSARYAEVSRIEFLLERDGAAATLAWVRRTLGIYRRAVLDRRHFAHAAEYRPKFIGSCLELRRWLITYDDYGHSATAPARAMATREVRQNGHIAQYG